MSLTRVGRHLVPIVLVLGVLAIGSFSLAREEPAPVWLVTEGEAMLPAAPSPRSRVELPNSGPVIRIQSPSMDGALSPPFPVEVVFEQRPGGAPVRVESLKVTYMKMFEIDVTERFKPYIRENRLFVEKANVPSGRHRFKVSIADQHGNTTAALIDVTVK